MNKNERGEGINARNIGKNKMFTTNSLKGEWENYERMEGRICRYIK
jgi:hypothetical protein